MPFRKSAQALALAGLDLVPYQGLDGLRLFNPDVEATAMPAAAQAPRQAVRQADALLIACPEYAHVLASPERCAGLRALLRALGHALARVLP